MRHQVICILSISLAGYISQVSFLSLCSNVSTCTRQCWQGWTPDCQSWEAEKRIVTKQRRNDALCGRAESHSPGYKAACSQRGRTYPQHRTWVVNSWLAGYLSDYKAWGVPPMYFLGHFGRGKNVIGSIRPFPANSIVRHCTCTSLYNVQPKICIIHILNWKWSMCNNYVRFLESIKQSCIAI